MTNERNELTRKLLSLYRPYMLKFPDTHMADVLEDRYDVREAKHLSIEQLQNFYDYLQGNLAAGAERTDVVTPKGESK